VSLLTFFPALNVYEMNISLHAITVGV